MNIEVMVCLVAESLVTVQKEPLSLPMLNLSHRFTTTHTT